MMAKCFTRKRFCWTAPLCWALTQTYAFDLPMRMDRQHFLKTCAVAVGVAALPAKQSCATTPTHVLNSVLSAYGIPMINEDTDDFTSSYIQLPPTSAGGRGTICAFAYPKAWVEVRKRDGLVSAANYQSGDGLFLDVGAAPGKASSIQQLDALAIAAEATTAQGYVKVLEESLVSSGGVDYKYLALKYNTVTRSGYDVERITYVASTISNRMLYSLVTTASSERIKKMKPDLMAIRESFRVANIDHDIEDR